MANPGSSPPPIVLWRDRTFVLFSIGRFVSAFGTSITMVVLPILGYELTGSALLVAVVTASEAIPYLLLGLPAAAIADRGHRRRIMIATDLLNAGLLASVPVAGALGELSAVQLVVVAMLSATLFVWFDAAAFGAVPALVGRAQIAPANGFLSIGYSAASIAGPAVGGVLVATLGPSRTVAVDAVSYLVSAASLGLIARSFGSIQSGPRTAMRADIAVGLRFVRSHPLVRTLTTLGAWVSFVDGMVKALIVVYAARKLGLSPSSPVVGLLFSAIAVGSLAGGIAATTLPRKMSDGRVTLMGMTFAPMCLAVFGLTSTPGIAVASIAGYEVAHTLVVINGISIRQRVTPDDLQGRVNVTGRMIAWGGTPFGAIVGGVLASFVAVSSVDLLGAVVLAGVALAGWLGPLHRRDVPAA